MNLRLRSTVNGPEAGLLSDVGAALGQMATPRVVPWLAALALTGVVACSDEPRPPLSEKEIAALDLRSPNPTTEDLSPTEGQPLRKEGEASPTVVASPTPLQEGTTNMLGWILVATAAGAALGRWAIPGNSGLERGTVVVVNGGITALAVAGGCAGIDPTAVYVVGTLANGVITGVSLASDGK